MSKTNFVGSKLTNITNFLLEETSNNDYGKFLHDNCEFQGVIYKYYEGKQIQSSEKFVTIVLGYRHYTLRTYRRYFVWEYPNYRVLANRDYGYGVEIRKELMTKENLHHAISAWDEVRSKFLEILK